MRIRTPIVATVVVSGALALALSQQGGDNAMSMPLELLVPPAGSCANPSLTVNDELWTTRDVGSSEWAYGQVVSGTFSTADGDVGSFVADDGTTMAYVNTSDGFHDLNCRIADRR